MSKICKLMMFFVVAFMLVLCLGCGEVNLEEVVKPHLFKDVDLQNVCEDLELPTLVEEVTITWTSDKPEVVSNEGKVSRPKNDTLVELTADLLKGKNTGQLKYNLTVKAKYEFEVKTVSEAIELAKNAGEAGTNEEFYVEGVITKITSYQYGEMYITDGTSELYVYGVTGKDGTYFDKLEEQPKVGDNVVLLGKLKVYKGSPELDRSKLIVHEKAKDEFDASAYQAVTIAEARTKNKGDLLKVTGVVGLITYANGMNPNGFYLIDETASIYVYGLEATAEVKVGNKITLCGEKDYYVLDSESANANKFGYLGCCQLKNGKVIENDKGNNAFNEEWIQTSTVKELLETPVTENITTLIYKVTGVINRVEGTGFINYYINDIDNELGSYVYTMCNGSDFDWLDKYNGKYCTVYLSLHNCKSTASDCFFRLIPVKVEETTFTMTKDMVSEYAVKYVGLGQFNKSYTSDPNLELLSSVSNEFLKFNDAKLSYSSSDTKVISFNEVDGKVVMNTGDEGVAKVTVTATYEGVTYSDEIEITVIKINVGDTITIKEAIDAADNTKVTVQGVVVSSVVNRDAFYISDETGIIAVTCDASLFDEISIGNLIVIEGTRAHNKKADSTVIGQSIIKDAKLIVNYYGEHQYETSYFIKDKTLQELYDKDAYKEDCTTSVYVLDVNVVVETNAHYTNIYIKSVDGKTTLRLYCSGAGQYAFLQEFADKTVTVELALCNWNDKTYYTGCVISVTYEGNKVINSLNFTK